MKFRAVFIAPGQRCYQYLYMDADKSHSTRRLIESTLLALFETIPPYVIYYNFRDGESQDSPMSSPVSRTFENAYGMKIAESRNHAYKFRPVIP